MAFPTGSVTRPGGSPGESTAGSSEVRPRPARATRAATTVRTGDPRQRRPGNADLATDDPAHGRPRADYGADDRRTAGPGCLRSRRRRIPRMRCVRADQPGSRRRPTSGCTPVRAPSATGMRNFGGRPPANVRTKARYALRVAVLRCPAREHPEPGHARSTTHRPRHPEWLAMTEQECLEPVRTPSSQGRPMSPAATPDGRPVAVPPAGLPPGGPPPLGIPMSPERL